MRPTPRAAEPAAILLTLGIAACTFTPEADVGGITSTSTSEGSTTATEPSTSSPADGASTSSSASAGTDTSEPGSSTAADSSTSDPPVLLDVGTETGGVETCAADAPDLIFVMPPSTPTEIWTYDPIVNEFAPFATVECEIQGYYTGFALDRDGDILLMSADWNGIAFPDPTMQLTRFDPDSGACEVELVGTLMNAFPWGSVDCADLAMVSYPGFPDHERLFAHSCIGGGFTVVPGAGGLFRADLDDEDPVFDYLDSDDYTSVAIAGTGDGRLYGVGGDQKVPGVAQIIEYDQETGAIISSETVPDLDIGNQGAYIALAFYGGDLYTFGLRDFAMVIHRYDLDDDDGNGEHDVTELPDPPSADWAGPAGVIAAASPTCIPLTPAG